MVERPCGGRVLPGGRMSRPWRRSGREAPLALREELRKRGKWTLAQWEVDMRIRPVTEREPLDAAGKRVWDAVAERRGGRVGGPFVSSCTARWRPSGSPVSVTTCASTST